MAQWRKVLELSHGSRPPCWHMHFQMYPQTLFSVQIRTFWCSCQNINYFFILFLLSSWCHLFYEVQQFLLQPYNPSRKIKLSVYWSVCIPTLIYGYELWPKLVSSAWCLGFPLESGWVAQSSRRGLEKMCCSFTFRGASGGGWFACLLETSLLMCSMHVPQGGDPEENPWPMEEQSF